MSRPIQTQPAGLLGFLQLKNFGQNPAELPDSLQAVLELRDWLWATNSETEGGTDAAIAAAGLTNKITVPASEWWVVLEVNIAITLAAASTATIWPYYRQAASGILAQSFALARPLSWDATTQGVSFSMNMDRGHGPVLLPPGGILGIRASFLSAATATGNMFARFVRLRA